MDNNRKIVKMMMNEMIEKEVNHLNLFFPRNVAFLAITFYLSTFHLFLSCTQVKQDANSITN